jgi:capsular polysaccharide transport system permease protein
MWFADADQEFFHRHYLSRVGIELDNTSGVLRIKAQAYTPAMAQAIASTLLEEGERFMNDITHRLARDQVSLPGETGRRDERTRHQEPPRAGRFPEREGFYLAAGCGRGADQHRRPARRRTQPAQGESRDHARLPEPDRTGRRPDQLQIASVENQLRAEKGRLTSPKGGTLNRTVEEYQRLEMVAMFAQDVYKTALTALERGRIEAIRNLKKVSIIQSSTLPQYPLEPRRIYNIIVFALSVLVLAGIVQLLAAIIRDHQD